MGLIQAERHFPMQILVSDAQYVYRGDPTAIPPNPHEDQAYFEEGLPDYCGRSHTKTPFNRSCPRHLLPPESSDSNAEEYEDFYEDHEDYENHENHENHKKQENHENDPPILPRPW